MKGGIEVSEKMEKSKNNQKKEGLSIMKTDEEILELVEGTIFGEVLAIMKSGDYEEVPFAEEDNRVSKSDNVLGELNDLEKALYTLRQRTIKKIMDSNRKSVNDQKPPFSILEKLKSMHREYDTVHELLWHVITKRIPSNGLDLSVKADWKVVGEKPNEQRNDFMDLLENFGASATIH
jgi:hypothetical protein